MGAPNVAKVPGRKPLGGGRSPPGAAPARARPAPAPARRSGTGADSSGGNLPAPPGARRRRPRPGALEFAGGGRPSAPRAPQGPGAFPAPAGRWAGTRRRGPEGPSGPGPLQHSVPGGAGNPVICETQRCEHRFVALSRCPFASLFRLPLPPAPRSAKETNEFGQIPARKKGDPPESSTPAAVRQQIRQGAKSEIPGGAPKPCVNPLRQRGVGRISPATPQKRVLVRPPPTKYRSRKIDDGGLLKGRERGGGAVRRERFGFWAPPGTPAPTGKCIPGRFRRARRPGFFGVKT